jgi:HAD superfamily 5'-nucleotidase-like hydrolase
MAGIYINRTINFKKIKYFGFDMDHTLIRYKIENFERLAHHIVLQKMVNLKGYPNEILTIPFEYDRVIRGLVVDKKRGNLLKLNIHGYIRASYHGTKLIDYKEQKAMYKGAHLDLSDPNYISVDTSFSISFGNLFAHLVEMKDAGKHELPTYDDISRDILDCVDESHADGSLKSEVKKNLDQYIIRDPELIANLEKYKKHGKKLFILTNSEFYYAKLLLDYAVTPFLKDHKDWKDLFDYVITQAAKPRFFFDKLPFYRISPDTGAMYNLDGKFEPGVYQSGCAEYFTNKLRVTGDDILYVGDHIYGDIVRLKKDCAWRTALVIEELEEEVNKLVKISPISDQIQKLMKEKAPYETEIVNLEDQDYLTGKNANEARIDALYDQVTKIDKMISEQITKLNATFNPYWGEVMRCGNEESYFAGQVARYACIYTSTLNDILTSSPRFYFRSYRRTLAHEVI